MKKVRHLLLAIVFGFSSFISKAQDYEGPHTPESLLDTVYDYQGNKFTLGQIDPNRINPSTGVQSGTLLCNAGYFDLYFETGSGMEGNSPTEQSRRAVVCQVFSDLSSFINSALTGTNTCRIGFKDFATAVSSPSTSMILGVGYPLYSMAPSTNGGIVDTEAWKTITSGVNSYSNVSSPLSTGTAFFYHGQICMNFANPVVNWNLNLTSGPLGTQYDFYTVVLHEALHMLGFASAIKWKGLSQFGLPYFNRYDKNLFTAGTSSVPLITNTGTCSAYGYSFNTTQTSSTALSPATLGTCATIPPSPQIIRIVQLQ